MGINGQSRQEYYGDSRRDHLAAGYLRPGQKCSDIRLEPSNEPDKTDSGPY